MGNQMEMKLSMTYREFLQTLKSGDEVVNFLNHIKYGCRQADKEYWKSHCLKEEYRGENGCRRCKIEFWDSEMQEEV